MIVDGKAIAEEIYGELRKRIRKLSHVPTFSIIACAPNFETRKYLELKEKKAKAAGIRTNLIELSQSSTAEDFLSRIKEAVAVSDAVIVQLPLPSHVDKEVVIASVPPSHDADALNSATQDSLSPVVGAIKTILGKYDVRPFEKTVTIIGSGKLVGLPAFKWFTEQGSIVSMVTKDTQNISEYTKNADLIVCGAGAPGLLTPEMVKEGVVILDAGTSEDLGELKGDANPRCAEKSSLFTPVPGGIGPLTIAILLQNVVDCAERK
jgi:methylenetetrahydrofolate dehydrogenase (NADP+)/methenyltetrahydrofolate cyclohydrolase